MTANTRLIIGIGVVAGIVLFIIGIIIGRYAIKQDSGDPAAQTGQNCQETPYKTFWDRYKQGYLHQCDADACYHGDCDEEDLPRTYLAYHLNGKTITIDGRLDDDAWREVPYSDKFVDIRGPDYPAPYFDSQVKVRWDDSRLYVAAMMQENNFWGTYQQDEDPVWRENAFEVYAVPDGSMHNYKEMQISVMNVTWDLMLRKTYLDGPQCPGSESVAVSNWSSRMQRGVYTDGGVNDPSRKGTFWSAEFSFSFEALAEFTDRPQNKSTPEEQEAWFFIFARPQYASKIVNGQYVKDESVPTEWWSWQPMYTVNLHLPSRFGLVQFKRNMNDKTFQYNKWHIYRALFEIFEAEMKYKSVNGMFIDELHKLDISPKFLSSKCVNITITLANDNFNGTVRSLINPNLPTGHIRSDRYVWFT